MLAGVFVVVLLVLAACGYRYGAGVILCRLVSLVGGYLSAFFFAHQVAQWLTAHSAFKGLDVVMLAAGLCFVAGYFAAGGIYRLLMALRSNKNDVLSVQSRVLGMLLGAALGVIVGGLAVWLGGMAQDMAVDNTISSNGAVQWERPDAVRRTVDRSVAKIANELMRVIGHVDAATLQASANVIAEPVRVSASLRQLAQSPEFRVWLEDTQAQAMMAHGDTDRLMHMTNFQELTTRPENLEALRTLQGTPSASHEVVARQFAETSATVWQKIQRVKSNPEFQDLIEDPEIVRLAQDPDAVQLMRSEKVRALVELVFTGHSAGQGSFNDENTTDAGARDRPSVIYQWKTVDGRTQFGDSPPKGALDVKRMK